MNKKEKEIDDLQLQRIEQLFKSSLAQEYEGFHRTNLSKEMRHPNHRNYIRMRYGQKPRISLPSPATFRQRINQMGWNGVWVQRNILAYHGTWLTTFSMPLRRFFIVLNNGVMCNRLLSKQYQSFRELIDSLEKVGVVLNDRWKYKRY